MTCQGRQLAIYAALITAVVKPLGGYTARIVDGNSRAAECLQAAVEV